MKIKLLPFVCLVFASPLLAQHNYVTLVEQDTGDYYRTDLHTNEHMVYLEAKKRGTYWLHTFNAENATTDVINFESSDHVMQTYFFNKDRITYYVVSVRKKGRYNIYIYEIEGSHLRKKHSYEGFELVSIKMGTHHMYIGGTLETGKSTVFAFDLKHHTFRKIIDGLTRYRLRNMHNTGDTLIIISGDTMSSTFGLNWNGYQWLISEGRMLNRNGAEFNGHLYSFSTHPDPGLFMTNGSKGNLKRIPEFSDEWGPKLKKTNNGLIMWGPRGIHFLGEGKTTASLISDASIYQYEPHRLDEHRVAVFKENKLEILRTNSRQIKTVPITKAQIQLLGMVSDYENDKVYLATGAWNQSDQIQNLYSYSHANGLVKYNNQPMEAAETGGIAGIAQAQGLVLLHTKGDKGYRLLALTTKDEKEVRRIRVEAYVDQNKNGIRDVNEVPFKGFMVRDELNKVKYFDKSGSVLINKINAKANLTVESIPSWKFTTDSVFDLELNTSNEVAIAVGLAVSRRYLAIEGVSILPQTRCNSNTWIQHKFINKGNVNLSGSIRFQYDSLITIDSSSVSPDSVKRNELYWNIDSLPFDSSMPIRCHFVTPSTRFMGEGLFFKIIYEGIDSKGEKVIFVDTFSNEITCAYDPNDKTVWPDRKHLDNQTLFTEDLTYRIRFQNTGTDTAFNIVVTDTLSPLLDWSTFRIMDNSHPMTTKHYDDGTVEFAFKDILLPDSHVNEPKSHGYIYYRIKPKKGLNEGSEIFNTAYIFFDFNPPIATNTTRNLMVSKIIGGGIELKPTEEGATLTIYPNPSEYELNIELSQTEPARLQIINISGQTLQEQSFSSTHHTLNVSQLPKGIYLINVWQGSKQLQARFVKN